MKSSMTDWKKTKLGEICELLYGKSLPARSRIPGNVPVYGSNGPVGTHNEHVISGPAIVIGRKGSIGEIHLVKDKCWPIDTTYYIDSSVTKCDLLWLSFYLKSLNLPNLNKAAAVPGLNRNDVYNLSISLPPLSEQKRIAAILNDHIADIVRARAAAEAQLEAAEALSTAYLREIFESKEAQEWPNVHLRDICMLVNGKAFKPSDWSTSGKPIIRIQNLNDATKPFNYWNGSLEKQVIVNPGTVLLAWSGTPGTSFGAHIWNREDGVLNQHIFRVDFTRPDISPQWFTYSVNQRLDVLIRQAHGGVGLRHVRKSQVEALKIPLPPLSEQKRIAAILNDRMADITRACTAIREKLETINQLPSAILRKAFNGEL